MRHGHGHGINARLCTLMGLRGMRPTSVHPQAWGAPKSGAIYEPSQCLGGAPRLE